MKKAFIKLCAVLSIVSNIFTFHVYATLGPKTIEMGDDGYNVVNWYPAFYYNIGDKINVTFDTSVLPPWLAVYNGMWDYAVFSLIYPSDYSGNGENTEFDFVL